MLVRCYEPGISGMSLGWPPRGTATVCPARGANGKDSTCGCRHGIRILVTTDAADSTANLSCTVSQGRLVILSFSPSNGHYQYVLVINLRCGTGIAGCFEKGPRPNYIKTMRYYTCSYMARMASGLWSRYWLRTRCSVSTLVSIHSIQFMQGSQYVSRPQSLRCHFRFS